MPASDERAVDPGERLQDALEKAYRYLGHRDRTVAEIRRHLAGKGLDDDTVEAAVAELGEQRYLDDVRFAQRFVEDRRALDAWGSERIVRRLIELGIDREDAAAALAHVAGPGELEAAVALLRRRFPVTPETGRDRDRALGLLVRKGYELDLAYDAIRALGRVGA